MKGINADSAQRRSGNRATAGAITLLIVLLVVMSAAFVYISQENSLSQQLISSSGELRVLSQRISTNASEAAEGKEEAFTLLREARNEFDKTFNSLNDSDVTVSPYMQPGDISALSQLKSIEASWAELRTEADSILAAEETVLNLHDMAGTLSDTIPQLQVEYDEVIDILLENGTPADQVALAQRQPWLAERIVANVSRVLRGGEDAIMAADTFDRDAKIFGRVLEGMLYGNQAMRINQITDDEALDRLAEIADLFSFVENSVDDILEISPELFRVRAASNMIFTDAQQLLQQTSILQDTFEETARSRFVNETFAIVIGVLAFIALVLVAISINRATQLRLAETRAQNEANQKAIMRLLNEMEDLADGDLTVSATVTEDFTGAIADSINFSIEQLRALVKTINQSAVEVDNSAQKTQSTAIEMAQAAENQAQEISITTQSVNDMSESMRLVSRDAAQSAEVASRSVDIATNGAQVVRNTINGMNIIREQIQDTSKRIKRLGESSQEIGNIISLINDIADQTNILSLNAAIQASMAGETGRGFAVVADEVQRLAERVSGATRQVETLVTAIQNDTNEAVTSMEQTTSQVVSGAQLAQDAGIALAEIEQVSGNLAALVRDISATARDQTESAAQISQRMLTIRDITNQTASGTTATANSVGTLAEMAVEMRQSVSGFRLPDPGLGSSTEAFIGQSVGTEINPDIDDDEFSATA
ncbi:methyl-accepting chemotaxis protein [Endozoicomonas gorgoniicola]|uniref:methyl-accepting chemotaxis protein n=1 Tax=Endozoicomonas gorgoniicola TaxID=1234144 RepID=UPI002AD43391|nr:methyl-accepting chemotaxis protein [Endozoicomonas gorgoniicola]